MFSFSVTRSQAMSLESCSSRRAGSTTSCLLTCEALWDLGLTTQQLELVAGETFWGRGSLLDQVSPACSLKSVRKCLEGVVHAHDFLRWLQTRISTLVF